MSRSGPGAGVRAWGLALLAMSWMAGCRTPALDPEAGFSCPIPITRGLCVRLPGGFDLADCTLYRTPETRGIRHDGKVWGQQTEADGGPALPSPCQPGELVLFGIDAGQARAGQLPQLVCNSRSGQACPPPAPSTRIECEVVDGGLAAELGPAVTAASLASDGQRVAAAWGQAASAPAPGGAIGTVPGAVDLTWTTLDSQLTPVKEGTVGITSTCRRAASDRVVPGASSWAAPLLLRSDSGASAAVLTTGVCEELGAAPIFQEVRFAGAQSAAFPLCPPFHASVAAAELFGQGDAPVDVLSAITLHCSTNGSDQPSPDCPGSGIVVGQVVARQSMACETDRDPLVEPPAHGQVPWIDLQTVEYGGPAASMRAPLSVILYAPAGQPPRVVARLFDGSSQPRSFTVLPQASPGLLAGGSSRPVMATGPGASVLVWADPTSGVVSSRIRYDSTQRTWHQIDQVLVFPGDADTQPSDSAPRPGVAVRQNRDGASSFGVCYVVGGQLQSGGSAVGVALVEDDLPAPPSASLLADAGTPCAITPIGELDSGGAVYAVLYVAARQLFSAAVPGGELRQFTGLGAIAAGQIRDLQVTAFQEGYLMLIGQSGGQYTLHSVTLPTTGGGSVGPALLTLGPGDYREAPRLAVDGDGAFVTYVGQGGEGLHHRQVAPGSNDRILLADHPSVARGAAVMLQAAEGTTPAVAFAGPYPGTDGSEGAWIRLGDQAPVRRLLPREPVGLGAPALMQPPDGRIYVGYGPSGPTSTVQGVRVTELQLDPEQPATVIAVSGRSDVSGVHLLSASGLATHGLATFTTTSDPTPFLASFPVEAGGVQLPVTGGGGVSVASATGAGSSGPPAGDPLTVELSPGLLGLTYCSEQDGAFERWLQPVDLQGQPVGARFSLGTQLSSSSLLAGAARRCPPATLIKHQDRLLASSVTTDGQLRLAEIRCAPR
jgi:hypothetical protein